MELIIIYVIAYLVIEFVLLYLELNPLFEELEFSNKWYVFESIMILTLLPFFALGIIIVASIVLVRGDI